MVFYFFIIIIMYLFYTRFIRIEKKVDGRRTATKVAYRGHGASCVCVCPLLGTKTIPVDSFSAQKQPYSRRFYVYHSFPSSAPLPPPPSHRFDLCGRANLLSTPQSRCLFYLSISIRDGGVLTFFIPHNIIFFLPRSSARTYIDFCI